MRVEVSVFGHNWIGDMTSEKALNPVFLIP